MAPELSTVASKRSLYRIIHQGLQNVFRGVSSRQQGTHNSKWLWRNREDKHVLRKVERGGI